MILIQCDMKSCAKQMKKEELCLVRIIDKSYDFCPECFNSLQLFIEHRLTGGSVGDLYQEAYLDLPSNQGVLLQNVQKSTGVTGSLMSTKLYK